MSGAIGCDSPVHDSRSAIRARGSFALAAALSIAAVAQAVDPPVDATLDRTIASNQGVELGAGEGSAVDENASDATTTSDDVAVEKPARLVGPRTVRRSAASSENGPVPARSTSGWYRTGLGSLAVVLTMVGVAYWAVRRWSPLARQTDHGVFRIVARTSIGPKQQLALVQLGRRFVMVGVCPDRLTSLCNITDEDEVAELVSRTGSGNGAAFDSQLLRESDEFLGSADADEGPVNALGPQSPTAPRSVKDLLKRLKSLRIK